MFTSHILPVAIFLTGAYCANGDDNQILKAFYQVPDYLKIKDLNSSFLGVRPIEDLVIFFLYTRATGTKYPEILKLDKEVLAKSTFNIHKTTKIVIHGFLSNSNRPMSQNIKNSYLSTGDVNVIVVDWGSIAKGINYPVTIKKVPDVGRYIGQLIAFLVENGCDLKSFHLIGHSLGAHVAGYAGSFLANGSIPRITGLDPARPFYENADKEHRLDASDADFVDCIHTCGGLLGLYEPIGHVDFYVNGGKNKQPGCYSYDFGFCSHRRSHLYFAESILPDHLFISKKCLSVQSVPENCTDSEQIMGNNVNTRLKGVFYTVTNEKEPYAPIVL